MSDFMAFLERNTDTMMIAIGQHLFLSISALALGMAVAIPLGIWLTDKGEFAQKVLAGVSIIQTVPGLAFLGLFLPLFGIGMLPAIIVLFLYSLLPILSNTYTGLERVSPAYIEAGVGMGMNRYQLLFMVKLPLALPVIIAGIRISAVYIVSWATLAAFIGGGGLGDPILTGIQTADLNFILIGAVPAAVLALLAGWALGVVERSLTPRGI